MLNYLPALVVGLVSVTAMIDLYRRRYEPSKTDWRKAYRRDREVAWGFIFLMLIFIVQKTLEATPVDWGGLSLLAETLIGLSIGATTALTTNYLADRFAEWRRRRRYEHQPRGGA